MDPILIYGANGYTGELCARFATEQGQRPVLSGRNAERVGALAKQLGCESLVFGLDEAEATQALQAARAAGVRAVLHCAGPFLHTADAMVRACLAAGVHYIDVTGEIPVFELLRRYAGEAVQKGLLVLPGAGFDVVPSDCLAAHLARRMPGARQLTLAFASNGGVSHGTATTMLQNVHLGGVVRRDGKLERVPAAYRSRDIDYGSGRGPMPSVTIPWGDVSTAHHSTGIPNIEVYTAVPASARFALKVSRGLGWLLGAKPVQSMLQSRIDARPAGPSDEERARGRCWLWGEAVDAADRKVVSRLQTPEGYTLTALTALECARRAAAGEAPAGWQTPSRAFGADFVLEFDGVTRSDD